MKIKRKIIFLRETFAWLSKYSGYDKLFITIKAFEGGDYKSIWCNGLRTPSALKRPLLKLILPNADPEYHNLDYAMGELKLFIHSFCYKPQLIHIAYIEGKLGIIFKFKKNPVFKTVATAHQPPAWWRMFNYHLESLSSLDALIVLSTEQLAFFNKYLPGRVYFIPHGIDTDFFRPKEGPIRQETKSNTIRCIFCGTWLRDFDTLAKVIQKVIMHNPAIKFDIIIPSFARNRISSSLIRMTRHKQIYLYSGQSDERLRKIYQNADMMLLPLVDCVANNALLEAIACGLPVISNNIGGVPDYTSNTFSELFPVGDVMGMANAILMLADNHQERKNRSNAARSFAVENFNWAKIAAQTIEVYQKILSEKYRCIKNSLI